MVSLSLLCSGLLENFYSRQAKVYMMAKNQLFHAAALHKLFVLRKEQKRTLTPEEEQKYVEELLINYKFSPPLPLRLRYSSLLALHLRSSWRLSVFL